MPNRLRYIAEFHIVPFLDFVLIERIEEKPNSKITLTDASKSILGRIVAVGPGKRDPESPKQRIPLEVKPGDTVYFNSRWNNLGDNYETVDWRYDDRMHLVQQADIFLRIDE